MSEIAEVKVEDTEVPEVVELSPMEQEALEEGWQPKEDWVSAGKDEADWRSAKEFKERGELFRRIESITQELKSTRSALGALKGHYEKVKDVEFKRAMDSLKADKKQALSEGDADAVIEIDEKLAEVREAQKAVQTQAVQQPEIHPDFTAWIGRNGWYNSNNEMRNFADSIGRAYALDHPGIHPADVLRYVTTKTKTAYPDQFSNPARKGAGAVEGVPATRKGANSANSYDMNEDEERVMTKLIKQGVITKEKYIADLKKIKGEK